MKMVGGITSPIHSHLRHGLGLPKLKIGRTRTQSSDSGCDVGPFSGGSDSPDMAVAVLEDMVNSWATRLEGVVRQEVERANGVTEWAKEALRHSNNSICEEGTEERKEDILRGWQRQMEGVMQFTCDLVECVNNDIKEVMQDAVGGRNVSGHDTSSTIEEELEDFDQEKEEEIMQLFLLSAIGDKKNMRKKGKTSHKNLMKEFMAIYKKNGKMFKKSRKASKEVQTAYSKIKRQDLFLKRRHSSCENQQTSGDDIFNNLGKEEDPFYSTKMFGSIMEAEEIFEDWNWNLKEFEMTENIFQEWRWNMEEVLDLKVKYYDTPGICEAWNDFNFWKLGCDVLSSQHMEDIGIKGTELEKYDTWADWSYWDQLQLPSVRAVNQEIDSGCLADTEEEERAQENAFWEDCQYWQQSQVNENIIASLLDGVIMDMNVSKSDTAETYNFWDESKANQDIIDSLIKQEAEMNHDKFGSTFIWEDRSVVFSLVNKTDEEEEKEVKPSTNYSLDDVDTNNALQSEDKVKNQRSDEDVMGPTGNDSEFVLPTEIRNTVAPLVITSESISVDPVPIFPWDDPEIITTLVSSDGESEPEAKKPEISHYLPLKRREENNSLMFPWEDKEVATSLVSGGGSSKKKSRYSYYAWEDQEALHTLIEHDDENEEVDTSDDNLHWRRVDEEEEDLINFSADDIEDFPWDDPETILSLVDSSVDKKVTKDDYLYPWLNPEVIISLVSTEEDMSKNRDDNNWENWGIWNQFGSTKEILKANEEIFPPQLRRRKGKKGQTDVNIQSVFWDISLDDESRKHGERRLSDVIHNLPSWHSPDILLDSLGHHAGPNKIINKPHQQKDPANIFKSFRHIFKEPRSLEDPTKPTKPAVYEERYLMDGMEDVYAEWAPNVLTDERVEKKRQNRGRRRMKGNQSGGGADKNVLKPDHKRPGTPTITTVTVNKTNKIQDFEGMGGWTETQKIPKKERKSVHVWRTARSQKRLNSKIYAKQPRSVY